MKWQTFLSFQHSDRTEIMDCFTYYNSVIIEIMSVLLCYNIISSLSHLLAIWLICIFYHDSHCFSSFIIFFDPYALSPCLSASSYITTGIYFSGCCRPSVSYSIKVVFDFCFLSICHTAVSRLWCPQGIFPLAWVPS